MSKDDKLTMARHTFDSRIKKVKEEVRAEMQKEIKDLQSEIFHGNTEEGRYGLCKELLENQKQEMLEKIEEIIESLKSEKIIQNYRKDESRLDGVKRYLKKEIKALFEEKTQ